MSVNSKIGLTSQRAFVFALVVGILISSCSTEDALLLESLPASHTGIHFVNQLHEDEDLNIITFEYFYNGAGVGVCDINNDGLQDIFFAANMESNKLYLNKGDLKFEDITDRSGIANSSKWATGVSIVDINQDGRIDIYVCYAGPFADSTKRANELYINNGDNTFSERAQAFGLADTGHSVQAAFFDYDRDGDLDMYLLTNITDATGPNVIRAKWLNGEMVNTDRLYKNNGNDTFTNVSCEAGITIEGYGLGVSVCDINDDQWADVYVTNDYLSNDILYINNGDGTFTDRAAEFFDHTSYSAMGNDVSDYNNDGLLDIISVDMLPADNKRQKLMFGATNYDRFYSEIKTGYAPQYMRNTLQLGRGKAIDGRMVFSEVGQLAGVHATDWSWSPLFADIDNDGWKDLLITNGYPRDITNRDFVSYKAHELMQQGHHEGVKNNLLETITDIEGAYLPNVVFQNRGDLTFGNKSTSWGFTKPTYSTGAAYADLDNDGDLEYITSNINEPASVFENHSNDQNGNHFLKIKIHGPVGNQAGVGAKVIVSTPGKIQTQEVSPYRGFQSSVDPRIHFGLAGDSVVTLRVRWPDGIWQEWKNIKADQEITIIYDSLRSLTTPERVEQTQPYFKKVSNNGINYKHKETHYVDFKIQPLLPRKYSEPGPGIAVADINGDGREDFFVGGAYNQQGQFYIQQNDGSYISQPLGSLPKYEEDTGVLFFDADNDGDVDLYVASGGSEFQSGSPYYQDRFYRNDGKGNFVIDRHAIPKESTSGSCVVSADYDNDGDLDLFVGGRIEPQKYPSSSASYIFENRGGRFINVSNEILPELAHLGMVTSALWSDFNNDDQVDLIVVGEWMPITLFQNNAGRFRNVTSSYGLEKSSGLWNCIQGDDLDRDGDIDYVIGNVGLNTRFKTSVENPLNLFVGDFNSDGRHDAILSASIDGVVYPAAPRDDLLQQLPSFKKYYPSYAAYAEETMESFLKRSSQTKTEILKSEISSSSVLINEGKAPWKILQLPIEAQFAPVSGVLINDYTNDGKSDLVLTGNLFDPDVLTGRYDALKGLLLQGNGDGTFHPLSLAESGLELPGDRRGLSQSFSGNGYSLLSVCNNDSLKVFNSTRPVKSIAISSEERYADIFFSDGTRCRKEFYFGGNQLSQSSRRLFIPGTAIRVVVYSKKNSSRTIDLTGY